MPKISQSFPGHHRPACQNLLVGFPPDGLASVRFCLPDDRLLLALVARQCSQLRFFLRAQGRRCVQSAPAREKDGGEAGAKRQRRAEPEQPRLRLEWRLQENEVAVARDEISPNRVVAFPLCDPLADEDAEVVGERGFRNRRSIRSGRPGSADPRTARGRAPRALDPSSPRPAGRRTKAPRGPRRGGARRGEDAAWDQTAPAGMAPIRERTAMPNRRRRSASDSPPPNAMAAPPSQISVTSGFQYSRAGTAPSGAGSPIDT